MDATTVAAPAPRWWSGRVRPSIAAIGLGAAVLPFVPQRAVEDGPVLCPFRRFTGLPCPGCGMTRSVTHFAHGEWRAAVHENLLGPVVYLAAIGLVVAAIGWRLGTPSVVWQRIIASPRWRIVVFTLGTVWALWAAVRLGRDIADGGA